MVAPRQSAVLPTIRCSSCGRQIEIMNMGEHVCKEAEPLPPLPNAYDTGTSRLDGDRYGDKYSDKYGRVPAPVDTGAANRPFMQRGQVTPASSSSESRSASPETPGMHPTNGRADDYFSPAIAGDYDSLGQRQRQQQLQRSGSGYGGYGDMDDDSGSYASSPKKPSGFLQRMNTIASGPFETGRRPRDNLDDRSSRPGTSASNTSFMSSDNKPRAPRKNGYGGFGTSQGQGDAPDGYSFSRSTTEPVRNPFLNDRRAGPPSRTPSVPVNSRRAPANTASGRSNDYADEYMVGDPYTSSDNSFFGRPSVASSQSSIAPSRASRRSPSDTSGLDKLMSDLQLTMDAPRRPGLSPRAPDEDHYASDYESPPASPKAPSRAPTNTNTNTDGRGGQGYGGLGAVSNDVDDRYGRYRREEIKNQPGRNTDGFDMRRRYESPERVSAQSDNRPATYTAPSRGNCKACGLTITGKSIKSADGRLTGRYHKACFVCTTCNEPFSSSVFYVLNDKPYCNKHYHKLNGSLCGTCSEGIEGQYLEDEALVKYHYSGCFCCYDCGRDLTDGYFEFNGKVYCERHAQRRVEKAIALNTARTSAASEDRDSTPSIPSTPNILVTVPEPTSPSVTDSEPRSNRSTIWPVYESRSPRAPTRSPTVPVPTKPGRSPAASPGLQRSMTERIPPSSRGAQSSRRGPPPNLPRGGKGVPPPRNGNRLVPPPPPPPPPPLLNKALVMQRRMTKIGKF